jgi:hypothetical protein
MCTNMFISLNMNTNMYTETYNKTYDIRNVYLNSIVCDVSFYVNAILLYKCNSSHFKYLHNIMYSKAEKPQ